MKQLKIAALLSYGLIAINAIYGIIVIPFILNTLGVSEYGIYKLTSSFSASLIVLDLGIGSTVMRYVAKFKAEDDRSNLENFSAMSLIEAAIISLIIVMASVVLYNLMNSVFSSTLNSSEISRAKQLFVILIINICLHIFENVVFGIVCGFNHFLFGNGLKFLQIIGRIILIYLLLPLYGTSIILSLIDLGIVVLAITIELSYVIKVLNLKIKYYFWDRELFFESFKYTLLLFVSSIVVQFNGNFDNILIGAYVGASAVTVFSIGLQLSNMFEQFAIALSSMILPTVTDLIHAGASNRELEDIVIKVGRMQFAILGAALAGFIIIGKEFVRLWLGNGYSNAWLVAIIIMLPTSIELIQNVCLSILRATNRLGFRTWAISIAAILNLLITIVGVKHYGYVAAAIGTATALFLGNFLAMNVYYYRIMKLNVFRIFTGVFQRTLVCLLVASIVLAVVNLFVYGSWTAFVAKAAIFCLIYGSLMLFYGFNRYEKHFLFAFRSIRKNT